jgi:hypothetical protein
MHVYIDESGNFISTPQSRVSCVAALAIPSERKDALFAAFAQRRQQFSAGVDELKGSALTEKQVAGVISLLLAHGALLEVCAIDMGIQSDAMTEGFKAKQADEILAHVTPKHQPSVVASRSSPRSSRQEGAAQNSIACGSLEVDATAERRQTRVAPAAALARGR